MRRFAVFIVEVVGVKNLGDRNSCDTGLGHCNMMTLNVRPECTKHTDQWWDKLKLQITRRMIHQYQRLAKFCAVHYIYIFLIKVLTACGWLFGLWTNIYVTGTTHFSSNVDRVPSMFLFRRHSLLTTFLHKARMLPPHKLYTLGGSEKVDL